MAYPCRGYCNALAVRTGTDRAVYAGGWVNFPTGTSGAVLKSTDFGATWESLPGPLPDTVFGIVADDQDGPLVFCATTSGVYRTTNEGQSWTRVLGQRGMRALARAGTRCAAAGDSGVWVTTDQGASWVKLDSGLGSTRVNCLEFMAGADDWLWLLAGTHGRAVFYWDFGPTAAAGPCVPVGCRIPASVLRARLVLDLEQGSRVRLLDAAGRTVLSRRLHRGRAELDVSYLPAGLYFVQRTDVESGKSVTTKVVVER